MSLMNKAMYELKKAGFFDADADYGGGIGEAVMELLAVLEGQGHSGSSASIVVSLFQKLAWYETLTPLTGEENEWGESYDNFLQNLREGTVFKNKKTGRAHYLDAIIWREPNGSCFNGSCDGVFSRQCIKNFPFIPKTFVIDVSKEGEDNHIKELKDLDAVWEYYNQYTQEDK